MNLYQMCKPRLEIPTTAKSGSVATRQINVKLTFSTNFNSCDLAVPGSPSRRTLMSPRSLIPSGRIFLLPPNKRQVIAFLISNQGGKSVNVRCKIRKTSTKGHTQVPKDTRSNTLGESFVQVITATELEELLLFFRGERSRTAVRAGC